MRLIATLDLKKDLLSKIKGVTEGHYDLGSGSEKELQRLASEVIQPYVNDKLSFSVNGTSYPLKVDRVERNTDTLFTVWLSTGKLELSLPDNRVWIRNRMFFDEVGPGHMDIAWFSPPTPRGMSSSRCSTTPNPTSGTTSQARPPSRNCRKGSPKAESRRPAPPGSRSRARKGSPTQGGGRPPETKFCAPSRGRGLSQQTRGRGNGDAPPSPNGPPASKGGFADGSRHPRERPGVCTWRCRAGRPLPLVLDRGLRAPRAIHGDGFCIYSFSYVLLHDVLNVSAKFYDYIGRGSRFSLQSILREKCAA